MLRGESFEPEPGERAVVVFRGGHFGGATAFGRYRVIPVAGWDALLARLDEISPRMLLLLEPHEGRGIVPAFWDVLQRFPSLAVIAAVPVPGLSSTDLRRMSLAGVSGIVNLRLRYPPPMVELVADDAFARPLKRRVDAGLSRFVSGDARILIRAVAETAVCGGTADTLAERFGVIAPTITRWCEGLHLPTPRRLHLWLRMLLVAQLMEDAGRPIFDAVRAAGYATDRSFRRPLRDLLGIAPAELRGRGAFRMVMAAFNADLRKARRDPANPEIGAVRKSEVG
jgi:AraC-like DNA-binding protein